MVFTQVAGMYNSFSTFFTKKALMKSSDRFQLCECNPMRFAVLQLFLAFSVFLNSPLSAAVEDAAHRKTYRQELAEWEAKLEAAIAREDFTRKALQSINDASPDDVKVYWSNFFSNPAYKLDLEKLAGPDDPKFKRFLVITFEDDWTKASRALKSVALDGKTLGDRRRDEVEQIVVHPGQENPNPANSSEPTAMSVQEGLRYKNLSACKKAIAKLLPAAQKGDAVAQLGMAGVYGGGCADVRHNESARLSWLQEAAKSGSIRAYEALGSFYLHSRYSDQGALAWPWFRRAASLGSAYSMDTLETAYFFGRGLEKDVVLAEVFSILICKVNGEACTSREFRQLNGIPLTPEQQEEISMLTATWKPGDPVPETSRSGRKSGYKWFERAAKAGGPQAWYEFGMFLRTAETDKDKEAAIWVRKAADQGHTQARQLLAHMYRFGQGVPYDLVLAYVIAGQLMSDGDLSYASWAESVKRRMPAAQLEEASQIAAAWKTGIPLPLVSKTWPLFMAESQ